MQPKPTLNKAHTKLQQPLNKPYPNGKCTLNQPPITTKQTLLQIHPKSALNKPETNPKETSDSLNKLLINLKHTLNQP